MEQCADLARRRWALPMQATGIATGARLILERRVVHLAAQRMRRIPLGPPGAGVLRFSFVPRSPECCVDLVPRTRLDGRFVAIDAI